MAAVHSSITTGTTKKRLPSAARRAKSLRLAPLTARDVEVQTGTASVRDPYDATSFLTAAVDRRVNSLAAEHAAGRITQAQLLVGRMIKAVYGRGSGARLGSAGWGEGGSRDQTVARELTHSTGAPGRLGRDLSGRFRTQAYAAEELVAEVGSALLMAEMGLAPEPPPTHASYMASWLKLLRDDSRAIFTAAGVASKAAQYLADLQG